MKGIELEVYSAGIETHGVNPNAVKVMAEAGVDISDHKSKLLDDFMDLDLDYVVTVCGHAHKTCPMFPRDAKVIHVGFDDPPNIAAELAENGVDEEEQLNCYRNVSNKIKKFVETLPAALRK